MKNSMIPQILNNPWAIIPAKLLEMRNIYERHLSGEISIDPNRFKAWFDDDDDSDSGDDASYSVQDGVAIIPIDGVIGKKMNLFMSLCGGTSTQLLQRDVMQAVNDPSVHSIILAIDSPGGDVDGTQAAANTLRQAASQKPMVALADGLMASAAYWLGSAASQIYMTEDTTTVGSIGVVATHVDYSKAYEDEGVKVTEITAGKYKRIASQYAPLSPEGRQTIQDQVDHIYSVFVDAVAANRGVSTDVVLDKMADGRVFLGQQAIDAGLVDGKATMDSLIAKLNDNYQRLMKLSAVAPAKSN